MKNKLQNLTFDFMYNHPKYNEVVVEADVLFQEPLGGDASDLDCHGYMMVNWYRVWQFGEPVCGDIAIPDKVIVDKCKELIRNIEIEECFERESGSF